ncbi:MAG: hypothetical protein JG777_58 [Clostridia bacterium]|jgi:hypothetical protein|uniref:hypothetical protein n=1 Tax=Petroclostridium xylanilyticum TaxID=1792311 RepID=UPI000B97D0EC|nr:hypothetical protein [Petroclostridium xylanilyticum]MBZ4644569.1 hypothetical protein [Clostridia bacterium]
MDEIENINLYSVIKEVEKYEDGENKLSNTFTDMLKNEIDATDEQEVYNNIRNLIYKYKDEEKSLEIIDEVVEALSDGAKLSEIFLIARDEIEHPTPVNVMNLDEFNTLEH